MWVGAVGLAGGVGLMTWAVRGRSSACFAPSVYHGPRDVRALALTFDDGPSPSTPDILEILDRYQVRATFFQCGMHVRRLPEIARAVAAAGHELGNHTDTHPCLAFRSPSFIANEIGRAQDAIAAATGFSPKWFRAPYGIRWFGLRQAQRSMNLTGVMWTVIGQDWKLNGREVRDRIMRGAENGAIICLHDGRSSRLEPRIANTVAAVRDLLPRLLRQGYRFKTVSELLCKMN